MAKQGGGGFAYRWGCRLFGLFLLLLPGSFRRRAGAGMREVFEARQREAFERDGVPGLLAAWLREVGGICAAAVVARRRDPWGCHAASREGADRMPAGGGGPFAIRTRLPGWTDGLRQDLRFTVRAAGRSRGAWLLALLTCALGVGASTAMFSVVDSVLWRPLPYPDPGRIVMVYPTIPEWRQHPLLADRWMRGSWSYPEYVDWIGQQTVFSQVAVTGRDVATITGGGEPLRIQIGQASPALFSMLGATPVLGRSLAEGEGEAAGDRVVLLSHGFWQSRFGGSADVIGQSLRTTGGARTIIGVLPETFGLTGLVSDVWAPIGGRSDERERDNHNLSVIARLAPGVTLERARQETERLLTRMSAGHRTLHGAFLVPRLEDETRQVRAPLSILLAASLLLLVVASVNVAALVLGMGIDRDQELIVRGAVGADRGRLVRQLVTESVVLAFAGGVAGVALAYGLTGVLVALAPPGIPRLDQVEVSARALLFASAVTGTVGIGFGLVPALSLTGMDLTSRMRGVRITGGRGRLHATLVVAQLALACVLLIGAGLLTRTLIALDRVDPGFDVDGVLGVRISPSYQRFFAGGQYAPDLAQRYYDDVRAALAGVPGVRGVAFNSALPFSGDRGNSYVAPGLNASLPVDSVIAERYYVSANYMELVGVRIAEGRGFAESDDRADAPPVVIVSETLARMFWPSESAVGKTLRFYAGSFSVVGVVGEIRDRSLENGRDFRFFIPHRQRPGQDGSFVVRVAPTVEAAAAASAIRERVWSVDPDVPIPWIGTLRQRVADSLVEQRFRARLVIAFACFAALFALLGIYGVTSRSVAARTREIGIRMALGERRQGVMRLVLRQGLRLSAIGAAIGLPVGLAAARVLRSFLYGTSAADPLTLGLVTAALAALALAASLPPSLRAVRVDPMRALRMD